MEITDHIKALLEARGRTWESAKAALDAAEGRDMTADEKVTYERISTELDTQDAEIRGLHERAERTKEIENIRGAYGAVILGNTNAGRDEASDKLNSDLRTFLRAPQASAGLEILSEKRMSPMDFRAMTKDLEEFRTVLVKGTANVGGNTIQTTFIHQLYAFLVAPSAVMAGNATIFETSSGETMQFPKVSARSSAAITSENAALNSSNPTFGTPLSLGAFKYSVLRQVSRELIEDTSVDLLGFLAEDAGTALGLKTGNDFINGAGSTVPRGLLLDAPAGVTGSAAVAGVFTADNLIDLYYSVIAPYRSNASWVLLDASMASVRKLKTSGSGDYIWQPSYQVGAPDTILGRPALTDSSMPAQAATVASVAFGDLSKYYIRLVNGVRFESSTDFAFSTDLVTYKTVLRADGALQDVNAVKTFTGGAAS